MGMANYDMLGDLVVVVHLANHVPRSDDMIPPPTWDLPAEQRLAKDLPLVEPTPQKPSRADLRHSDQPGGHDLYNTISESTQSCNVTDESSVMVIFSGKMIFKGDHLPIHCWHGHHSGVFPVNKHYLSDNDFSLVEKNISGETSTLQRRETSKTFWAPSPLCQSDQTRDRKEWLVNWYLLLSLTLEKTRTRSEFVVAVVRPALHTKITFKDLH